MKIRAVPNAKNFSIRKEESWVARVCAQAQDNKANKELLKQLSKIAGAKARLVKGAKSREKEIVFEGLTDEEAEKRLMQKN